DVLLADLAQAAPAPPPPRPSRWRRAIEWPFGFLWWLDGCREWFRDQSMRRLQVMRARLLQEGARLVAEGRLDRAEDPFLLGGPGPSSGCAARRYRRAWTCGRRWRRPGPGRRRPGGRTCR